MKEMRFKCGVKKAEIVKDGDSEGGDYDEVVGVVRAG